MMRKLSSPNEFASRKSDGYTRRQVLVSAAAGLSASLPPIANARADDENWYDHIFCQHNDSDTISHSGKSSDTNGSDTRTGSVPLMSEEMLERFDRAIAEYNRLVKNGGWPILRQARFLRKGARHETVAIIRKQLRAMGDMAQSNIIWSEDLDYFDEDLSEALKNFQERHGLRITRWLDRSTRHHLSYSAQDRLDQLKKNRDRLSRLMKLARSEPYILVNVPGYQLEAVSKHLVERRHTVIVGRSDRQTPDMSAVIRGVNFFPYWRVPQSIAQRDLIPRIRSDLSFLAEQRFRIAAGSFSGPELAPADINWANITEKRVHFRQDPGPWNALGLVRINMPNKNIIYLHDTPLKHLFKQRHRAFSAGCIRVQNVMDLVAWIGSGHQNLDRRSIDKLIETTNPADLREKRPHHLNIALKRPLPVHLAYLTAWIEDDDKVAFRTDIYNRDPKKETRLPPPEKPSGQQEISP